MNHESADHAKIHIFPFLILFRISLFMGFWWAFGWDWCKSMQIYPSFTIAGWKEQRAVDGDPEIEFLGENWLDAITTLPPLDNTKEGGNHKPIWCGDRFFFSVCVCVGILLSGNRDPLPKLPDTLARHKSCVCVAVACEVSGDESDWAVPGCLGVGNQLN